MFGDVKNKLIDMVTWATSQTARTRPEEWMAVADNVSLYFDCRIKAAIWICCKADGHWRGRWVQHVERIARSISVVVLRARKATQRSVKYIR